jgi:hypothetical protein
VTLKLISDNGCDKQAGKDIWIAYKEGYRLAHHCTFHLYLAACYVFHRLYLALLTTAWKEHFQPSINQYLNLFN